ncbi:MAG: DUF378 domain-containing protein [Alphaproteobacteria bacterium CG11_big_fil_rev_8_21_14_0_20_44_7]|nr:MAG: DUF378 domain-containing protein [Alphaproteobacteria bacterium CG11_big_fil_rev_8_21_14_0_20_44_7]
MTTTMYKFTTILIMIGAINLGLVGAFDLDIVSKLLVSPLLTKIVYVLIGVSAILHLVTDGKKLVK